MNKLQFLECRHAIADQTKATRECHSPKLWGLKRVSPHQCNNCYCRDHELIPADVESRVQPCSFRGKERDDSAENGKQFSCDHGDHDLASDDVCQSCPDYLFPIMTPNTPIDMAMRLMQAPYRPQPEGWAQWQNVQQAFHQLTEHSIQEDVGDVAWDEQRGIVIVGGGRYFDSTYVTVRVIRKLGCSLPIEIWHLDGEINDEQRAILDPFDVIFCNAEQNPRTQSFRFLNDHWWRGWQLKSCALRYCSFREVLLLDSDCYPVRNPEYLFDWPQFQEWGAVFWPDLDMNRDLIKDEAWNSLQVKPIHELPTESGQVLMNRDICRRELHLACHFNQHADYVYNVLYGDKDTFPIAWQRLGRRYARMWPSSEFDSVAIKQFDFNGQVTFLHRVHDKFRCNGTVFDGTPQQYQQNQFHDHFPLESYCFSVIDELRCTKSSGVAIETECDLTPPSSIEEMYPPVRIEYLVQDNVQDEFRKLFIESGIFGDDPFGVDEVISRPQTNCVSVSLFKQSADNHFRNQFPIDEERWQKRYWQSFQKLVHDIEEFPDWKLRGYIERQLWGLVESRFRNHPQVELLRMKDNSVGASPGAMWRYLPISDPTLEIVFATDIDEPFTSKLGMIHSFQQFPNASLGRLCTFSHAKDYRVHDDSMAKNYATIFGSCVSARPRMFQFDMASAMRGFMVHRYKQSLTERPWAYSDQDTESAFNLAVGNHVFGWGSHWFMYGFDERFLKHVLYYHFANRGNLLTWASTRDTNEMSPEGLCDFRYVTERGNRCIT